MVPVSQVVTYVVPGSEVVVWVVPLAEVIAYVALVAEVVVRVRSCRYHHHSHCHQVHLGPRYGTAWSWTLCYCIVELRRIGIGRGSTGTHSHRSWLSQGMPIKNIGGSLSRTY